MYAPAGGKYATRGNRATKQPRNPEAPTSPMHHATGTPRNYITTMRITLDLPLAALVQAEALCNPAKRPEALRATAEAMKATQGAKAANAWLEAQTRPRHRPLTVENVLAEILSKVLANGDFSQ